MNEARSGERTVGRYAMSAEIAAGGMATVHLGKLLGPVGFSRIVAIKALHPQFAKDPDFLSMFLDEARLAGRVRHPNVVSVFDVVARNSELYLVMDYVPGETLARLTRMAHAEGERVPLPIALSIVVGALEGLHAAHEACDEFGQPLGIVHRDVSPQNILVGTDGSARILDFGVAKAVGRMQSTRNDQLKGKLAYMAPEQLSRAAVDRGVDIYAASIVLWELLTRQRLFQGDDDIETFQRALDANIVAPSQVLSELPAVLDAIVLRGLARERSARFATARELARALEQTGLLASARDVGEWVERIAHEPLAVRARQLAAVEQGLSAEQAQRELDPEQARNDASLLRKIDRRAEAEQATDILGMAALSPPPAPVEPMPPPRAPEKPRPRRARWVGAMAALAALSIALLMRRTAPPPEPEAALGAPPAVTELPSFRPEVPTIRATAEPEAPPQSAPAMLATHPALASGHPRASTHLVKVEASSAKPKTNCSVPFTIDEHGVRIPKRECL